MHSFTRIQLLKYLGLISSLGGAGYAQTLPFQAGLLGGGGGGPAYAALVTPGSIIPQQLTGGGYSLTVSLINSVAINDLSAGLIGGVNARQKAYAAVLTPGSNKLKQLTGGHLPKVGKILSVAINSTNTGLIGGQNSNSENAYAALVSPGTTTLAKLALTGASTPLAGQINSVAINSTGFGLIGGFDSTATSAYAAWVTPGNLVPTQLTGGGLPLTSGVIQSVAINDAGIGLIGGGPSPAYAAFVSPGSLTPTQLTGGGLPPTSGVIQSVAINKTRVGLIGGQNTDTSSAYAARVSFGNSTPTQLTGLPVTGAIHSVAINDTGVGLIGGEASSGKSQACYAALVPPGSAKPKKLAGLPVNGTINSVAINKAGVGLIGGTDNSGKPPVCYAALVAPNGTVNRLAGDGLAFTVPIYSVAINNAFSPSPISAVMPTSIGPYTSAMNMQLAADKTLEVRLTTQSRLAKQARQGEPTLEAAANDTPQCTKTKSSMYTLWAAPFGEYLHLKEAGEGLA